MSSDSGTTSEIKPLVNTAMVVVAAIFPVLSFIAVVMRFMARRKSGLKIGADDWLTVVSWLTTIPLSIIPWVFGAKIGVDTFKVDLLTGIYLSVKCIWLNALFLALCLPIIKISIILFYKRVFTVKWFQVVSWVAIVAIGIWGTILFFLTIFQGHPISIDWTGMGEYDINPNTFGLTQAATSFVIDLFVLSLPIPVVYRLHLPTKQKLAVAAIFGLGAFCVVAAITRLALLVRSLNLVLESRGNGYVAIDSETLAFMFFIIEPNCSIIAGCLPCLGPLVLGMRAPESLVRSVRSMISLRSPNASKQTTPKGSAKNSPKGTPKATVFSTKASDASVGTGSQTTQDEEHELFNHSAPAMPGDDIAHVRAFPAQAITRGSNEGLNRGNGINVTKSVEVHTQNR